jgi:hypothetical protein
MSLARASDDPSHKHRYEDWALDFAQSAAGQRDFDITLPAHAAKNKIKSRCKMLILNSAGIGCDAAKATGRSGLKRAREIADGRTGSGSRMAR